MCLYSSFRNVSQLHGGPKNVWKPVIDGIAGYLPRSPLYERKSNHYKPLPIMAGYVHDEYSVPLSQFMEDWDGFDWENGVLSEKLKDTTIRRIAHYFNAFRFNDTVEELNFRYTWWLNQRNETARREQLVKLLSDWSVVSPVVETLKFHLAKTKSVYLYEFAHRAMNDPKNTKFGIYKGSEMPFLLGYAFMNETFWLKLRPEKVPDDETWMTWVNATIWKPYFDYPIDTNVSAFMAETWSNFIKYGQPTPEVNRTLKWKPYDLQQRAFLHIYKNSTVQYIEDDSNLAFWANRFESLAELLPASPQKYYHPFKQLQLATVVTSAFLLVILVAVLVLCVAVIRKPKPEKFRQKVRLAAPAAHPSTAFKSNFWDARVQAMGRDRQMPAGSQIIHPPPPAEPPALLQMLRPSTSYDPSPGNTCYYGVAGRSSLLLDGDPLGPSLNEDASDEQLLMHPSSTMQHGVRRKRHKMKPDAPLSRPQSAAIVSDYSTDV